MDCEGEYDYEETVESLKKVFGIVGICPVVRKPVKEIEELKKDIVAYVGQMYPEGDKTFKVEARRANKRYPMNSMEINCELGEAVLDAYPGMKVDVHHPDIRLNVEIREEVYGSGGHAGRDKRQCDAALIRRYRQPGGRLYDR